MVSQWRIRRFKLLRGYKCLCKCTRPYNLQAWQYLMGAVLHYVPLYATCGTPCYIDPTYITQNFSLARSLSLFFITAASGKKIRGTTRSRKFPRDVKKINWLWNLAELAVNLTSYYLNKLKLLLNCMLTPHPRSCIESLCIQDLHSWDECRCLSTLPPPQVCLARWPSGKRHIRSNRCARLSNSLCNVHAPDRIIHKLYLSLSE